MWEPIEYLGISWMFPTPVSCHLHTFRSCKILLEQKKHHGKHKDLQQSVCMLLLTNTAPVSPMVLANANRTPLQSHLQLVEHTIDKLNPQPHVSPVTSSTSSAKIWNITYLTSASLIWFNRNFFWLKIDTIVSIRVFCW